MPPYFPSFDPEPTSALERDRDRYPDEPDVHDYSNYAREQEELSSYSEDAARSEEDGWFYSDDD